jgi:hypothetical protein
MEPGNSAPAKDSTDELSEILETASVPTKGAPRRTGISFLPFVLVGILLIVVAIAGGIAFGAKHIADRAFAVRDELTAARAEIAKIPALAQAKDTAGLEAAGAALTEHANAALAETDDPIWTFFEQIPVVGENLSAVRKTTAATQILVEQGLPPAIQLLGVVDISRLGLKDGRVDVSAYQAALPMIPALRDAVSAAQAQVADINYDNLVPQVEDAISELTTVLSQASPALDQAEKVLPVALRVLGQNEPRNYLLMFQNNAETRATGGNPASLAMLHIENGAITLPEIAGSQDLASRGWDLPHGLPSEMLALYESDTIGQMMNYTRTPDFPTSARLMSMLWQQEIGGSIDGVISLDVRALQYILAVTGPVTLADGGVLDSDNAARVLLEEAYDRFPNGGPESDAYFASAVSSVFTKVTSGTGSPTGLLDAMTNAVATGHVMTWFTREDEQAMAVEVGASGTFAPDNSKVAQVGIFLNDSGYGKLDYYLSSAVSVKADTCKTGDGPATITTSITLTSAVPSSGLSHYALNIRGPRWGVPRTTIITDVLFFAPVGGQITGSDPGSGDWRRLDRSGVEQGRQAESITIGIPRGGSRTVTFTSTVDRASLGTPGSPVDVRTTPMLSDPPLTIEQTPCG